MPDNLADLALEIAEEMIDEAEEDVDGLDASDCDVCGTSSLHGPRTLRCKLFGCKHLSDKDMQRHPRRWCDTHQTPYYRFYNGSFDVYGRDVHLGCCIRCCNPIPPRARALKGSP